MPRRTSTQARARDLLKSGIRAVGASTASFRPAPDFLVIGTKRGGTTSFYFDLIDHPSVVRLFPPPVPGIKPDATKGVHYFDSNYGRGERWYRSYMPTAATRALTTRRHGVRAVAGEASPYYLFHPDAARRAHASVPEARLIVLLRDPVQRAYSHWKERRRAAAEELSFLDAIDAEPSRLAGEKELLLAKPGYTSYAYEQQSYVSQSRYAASLQPWMTLYGPEKLLVLASEDYYTDPIRVLADTDDFLGLPRRTSSTGAVRNAAPGDSLPPEARRRLEADLAGEVEALTELVGRPFPWL